MIKYQILKKLIELWEPLYIKLLISLTKTLMETDNDEVRHFR